MMNYQFPQWLTADIIIPDVIMKDFSLRVWPSEDFRSTNVDFIPKDALALIPPEDREKFIGVYLAFSTWALRELRLGEILMETFPLEYSERGCAQLSDLLWREEQKRVEGGKVPLKQVLLACLGCAPPILVPGELRFLLQGGV